MGERVNSGEQVLYLCIFRQIWRGVCGERPELALFVHFSGKSEAELAGKKSKIRRTARELEWKDAKRQISRSWRGIRNLEGKW